PSGRRRGLDQGPQGRIRIEIDHAPRSHRRRALLGLDRRRSEGLRQAKLPSALHPASPEKPVEQDQRRECRAADKGRPNDQAWLKASRGGQGRWTLGSRLCRQQGTGDARRPARRDRRGAEGKGDACKAQRTESLRARLPGSQLENGGRSEPKDRRIREDAQARGDDLSATRKMTAGG